MKTSASFLLLVLLLHFSIQAQPPGKRMLVVSGGGARGAWAVGMLDSLKKKEHYTYDFVVGTSTGALIAPFALFNDSLTINKLETAYTSVTQKKIFNRSPFNQRTGELKGLLWLAPHALFGRTLGRTEHLKGLIEKEIDPSLYRRVLEESGKNFAVAVVNLRTYGVAYKFARPCSYFDRDTTTMKTEPGQSYEDMTNWIWASCNQPVFMSLFETDSTGKPARKRRQNANEKRDFWVDGGTRDNIPVVEALKIALSNGFGAVDVLINNPVATVDEYAVWPRKIIRGKKGELPMAADAVTRKGKAKVFSSLFAALTTFRNGIRAQNVEMGALFAELNNLKAGQSNAGTSGVAGRSGPLLSQSPPDETDRTLEVSFYFLPDSLYRIIPNDLLFDKGTMGKLLRAGKKGAFSTPATVKTDQERLKNIDPRGYDSQKKTSVTSPAQQKILTQGKADDKPTPLNYKVSAKQLKTILENLEK